MHTYNKKKYVTYVITYVIYLKLLTRVKYLYKLFFFVDTSRSIVLEFVVVNKGGSSLQNNLKLP